MNNTVLNDHMFAITKEQLHQINDEKVKEWFPNAFDNHLIKGAWYNVNGNILRYKDGNPTYGFWNGDWGDNWKFPSNTECTLIMTSECIEKILLLESKKH